MYLSAEKFMYQFVRALRANETINFKEVFRSVDVLMMDDVQFIAGKESTQEEFFHTFNALVDQNKQIIISADKSPPIWSVLTSACVPVWLGAWWLIYTRRPMICALAFCNRNARS